MIHFKPFPFIETINLKLRRMNDEDIFDLFEMRSDPRMNVYVDTVLDKDINDTKAYIDKMNKGIDENKWIIWAIEHKNTEKVIGTISIWNINLEDNTGELGYGIVPDYQGKGFMKEALLSIVDYGFHIMKLKSIHAYTEEENSKSVNLLKKCNFHEIDKVIESGYFTNKDYHMIVYSINR